MASPTEVFYTATATSTGDGRNGHVATPDGNIDLDLASPTAAGEAKLSNPEQLFAAGYAACFHSAMKAGAKNLGIDIQDSAVVADVGIGKIEGGFGLKVDLHVELGGVSQEDGERAAAAGHAMCPYSNATRGNIDVNINVTVA